MWHDEQPDGLTVNDDVSTTSDKKTRALRQVLQCLMCLLVYTHMQGAFTELKPKSLVTFCTQNLNKQILYFWSC